MAWFKCNGGSGMPSGLQASMNAVLNKKFGTATSYAPATWPDNVNLMGVLQEKTIVSWPVSSFSDGADDVPTKSIVVTIPPTISGVSSVSETQTGKNLVDNSAAAWEGGNINTSGENATGAGYVRTIGYFDIGGGMNYEISGIAAPSQASDFRLFFYDETKTFISYKNYGSTPRETPTNARYFRIRNVVGADMSTLQIEYGTTAHAYEPYVAPTQYAADLGRTIYGGQVDIVNGTGTDNCTKIKISDLNWTYYTAGTNPIFYANNVPDMKTYARAEMPNIAIDGYTTRTAHSRSNLSTNMANMECSAIENAQTIAFRNDTYTSVSAMLAALGNEYIGYEVATPTDFTFDGQEIPTRLGYNAFWSDEGDTEVTYRSSGTMTPVLPTLISKSITANGTYSAEDDGVDGYSQVTVNVPQGSTIPFEKVWSSGNTGAETFTCTEAGTYMFLVGTSAQGTATITSSVTADFTFSKQGSDGRGLVIAVYTLAVGDTVTMSNTIVDWVYRTKAVFKTSLSVSTMVDSAIVTDGTLSSFAPTFTGDALFIYMAGGRADTNSYDRTYATDNFEWASKCETQTFIRLSYGSNTPTPSIYGYDGGCALAICLQ